MAQERDENARDGRRAGRPAITRRTFLRAGAAAGVAGALAGRLSGGLSPSQGRLIEDALASASGGSLSDIKHIVILMQENRSFDHYFGTMQGVRGFTDKTPYKSFPGATPVDYSAVFNQSMVGTSIDGKTANYALSDGETVLKPFELVSRGPAAPGQALNDITHDWGPQHGAWNNGQMDRFMIEHIANDPVAKFQFTAGPLGLPIPGTSTVPTGIASMGYYRDGDFLSFYRALADAFTICDGYHCSVIGPTDPNRLMSLSGSLGAHSADVGGPILTTYVQGRNSLFGTLDWPTIMEVLTENSVSWKVYQDPTSNLLFNVLPYFKHFFSPQTATQVENAANALAPVYPIEFDADVASGCLPQVSWILPPAPSCEHPGATPENGEWLVSQILQALVANPEVWAQTVFIVNYDENGGFFDHVAPPTPGPTIQSLAALPTSQLGPGGNLDGEYVTVANPTNAAGGPPSDWANVLGPVGLGFRTPALVVSPFSAGGFVCSDTFDHISVLKFIESVFLDPSTSSQAGTLQSTLHVSPWRYDLVGDMTTALANLDTPITKVPCLPPTTLVDPQTAAESVINSLAGTVDDGAAYPPPPSNNTQFFTQDSEPSGFTRTQIKTKG